MSDDGDPWGRKPSEDGGRSRFGLYLWIGILVVGALCLWQLSRLFPSERSDWSEAALIRNVAILALLSAAVIRVRRADFPEIARHMAIWVGIVAVLVIGVTYQDELRDFGNQVRGEFVPGYAVSTAHDEMVLTETGGHFIIIGAVNGEPVQFMVDTGASDITLTPSDARRVGLDPSSLEYTRTYSTANGTVRGAPAHVARLRIGDIVFTDVPVSVNEAEMQSSLLGMDFLRRLKSYEVRGRKLYLRW